MKAANRIVAATCTAMAACGGSADSGAPPVGGDAASETAPGPRVQTGELDSLMAYAEALHGRAEFDSARLTWESALARARQAGDRAREARVLTWLGLGAWRQGRYDDAERLGRFGLNLKLERGFAEDLWMSYNALGLLAWHEGRLQDAAGLLDSAFAAASASDDAAGIARATNNLALVQTDLGHFEEARAGYLETLRAGREIGDARVIGGALTNLGMLEIQLGEPDVAIRHLQEARTHYRAIDYATGEQNALGQLGTAYDALGQPGLALAALDSALATARALGLKQEEASNLELIAALHWQGGDLRGALRLYGEANRLNTELGLANEIGWNLRTSAELRAALGDPVRARQDLMEAREIHSATGARLEEMRDLLLLSDLASKSGDAASATRWLREADAHARALDARTARIEVALGKAAAAFRFGEPRRVLAILRAADADLARGGYGSEWLAASLRTQAFARLDMLDSAVIAGRQAVAAVERLRGSFSSPILGAQLTSGTREPYVALVDVLLRLRRPHEAFEVADASRTASLLRHLPGTRDRGPVRVTVDQLAEGEALLRTVGRLTSQLAELEETPSGERDPHAKALIETVARELEDGRAAYETLLARTAQRDALGATFLGTMPSDAADVRRALLRDEALVEYFVAPDRILAFVVTRAGVRSVSVDVAEADLARRVRVLRDLLSRPAPEAGSRADQVLEGLYGELIAPLEHAGLLDGVRRLLVVPGGSLAYLPFAALKPGGPSGYLVERYAVSSLPSAAALVALRRGPGPTAPNARLSTAVFAPFPRSLPASLREARTVHGRLQRAELLEGRRATEPRLRAALASDAVVHVATHGIMNPRNPMFSRLDLAEGGGGPADDGRLEVHELLGLSIGARLVFLSGCETGLGSAWSTSFARGDDYATLAQAFLYAGAESVVATLWRINDEGAARFAERFYRVFPGLDPTEALADAQRSLLRHSVYRDPHYWAAYTVAGVGRQGTIGTSASEKPLARIARRQGAG